MYFYLLDSFVIEFAKSKYKTRFFGGFNWVKAHICTYLIGHTRRNYILCLIPDGRTIEYCHGNRHHEEQWQEMVMPPGGENQMISCHGLCYENLRICKVKWERFHFRTPSGKNSSLHPNRLRYFIFFKGQLFYFLFAKHTDVKETNVVSWHKDKNGNIKK